LIGSGLEQSKSLVKLRWSHLSEENFLEEILFGLGDHTSLKNLELETKLTKSSSQALRSLLHFNEKLESLTLWQLKDQEMIPTMVSALAGLARNTGLTQFSFGTDSDETNATVATAWTAMLQRNTFITMLDLSNTGGKENANADCKLCSAAAKGLVDNFTIETLHVPKTENGTVLNGSVWQEMLERNHCVKKLFFSNCSISLEAFQCIARG
jgi:hypothetical protein